MITIGVDPGLSGAVAILRNGAELIALLDMPVTQSGAGGSKVQKAVDGGALAALMNAAPWLRCTYAYNSEPVREPVYALVERTTAMPGQGVSSMYSMGHSRGVAEGVLGALGIETFLVPAAVWKRHMGYTADKEPIRAEMQRLFPSADLRFKKHADRAEALAMALYLYRQKK